MPLLCRRTCVVPTLRLIFFGDYECNSCSNEQKDIYIELSCVPCPARLGPSLSFLTCTYSHCLQHRGSWAALALYVLPLCSFCAIFDLSRLMFTQKDSGSKLISKMRLLCSFRHLRGLVQRILILSRRGSNPLLRPTTAYFVQDMRLTSRSVGPSWVPHFLLLPILSASITLFL